MKKNTLHTSLNLDTKQGSFPLPSVVTGSATAAVLGEREAPNITEDVRAKQGGFSLPSVIVGSVIAAVLGGVAVTSMWGSVDKASIAAEVGTISEIRTAVSGLREDTTGYPLTLDSINDARMRSRLGQMPNEFTYYLVSMVTGTDNYLALKAVANSSQGRDRLLSIKDALEARYTPDRFTSESACATPNTLTGNHVDCFYAVPLMARTSYPDGYAFSETSTLVGGTEINTDFSAETDNFTILNPQL